MLLESFGKRSMSEELGDLQNAFPKGTEGTCFDYKPYIPLYFWNLILRVYGLEIIEISTESKSGK